MEIRDIPFSLRHSLANRGLIRYRRRLTGESRSRLCKDLPWQQASSSCRTPSMLNSERTPGE